MPTADDPSSYAPMPSACADSLSRLDVERICRVLIRIAEHFEETHHEKFSTSQKAQQQPAAASNGMGTH